MICDAGVHLGFDMLLAKANYLVRMHLAREPSSIVFIHSQLLNFKIMFTRVPYSQKFSLDEILPSPVAIFVL